MAFGIVTAGGGHGWETGVVAEVTRSDAPLNVVRRCADIADVLAIASTGQISAAILAADLRRLDSESVQELQAFGVVIVGIYRAGDDRAPALLERIGVNESLPDDASAAAIVHTIVAAVRQAPSSASAADGRAVVGSDPMRSLRAGPTRAGRAHGGRSDGGHAGAGRADAVRSDAGRSSTGSPSAGHGDAGRRRSDSDEAVHPDPAAVDAVDGGSTEVALGKGRGRRRSAPAGPAHAARNGRGRRSGLTGLGRRGGGRSTRRERADAPSMVDGDERPSTDGRVIAVWGPTGAPGRSTVAMGLADRMVEAGLSVLLIDADVYGGVLANAFGLLDESAGLAGACRLAANGNLGREDFAALCWQVRDRLTLLTGIARADRWPEVRPSAVPHVLDRARAFADVVIVDCASVLEADEEISFDTLAPRRNGATLAMVGAADVVVAVGAADPAGMERLARGYADVTAQFDGIEPVVVFNKVRPTAASAAELREASKRFCGCEPIAFLPEDRASVDLAWQRGLSLSMVTPKSPLVDAFEKLARKLAGAESR